MKTKKKEHSWPGRQGDPSSKKAVRTKPIITLRGDGLDPDYLIRRIDRNCIREKAISIRSSTRWLDTFKTPNGGLSVPFIDELGRITGHTLYRWSCDPRSLITTVVATISNRLVRFCRRHNPWHIVRGHLKALLEASAYYAFSKNSYFWDRVLHFSRNLKKRGNLIRSTRLSFSSKWDDNKRFVYSQVTFQTNWLLFRAFRPRDKSHFFNERRHSRWRKPSDVPSREIVSNCMREIAYAISQI